MGYKKYKLSNILASILIISLSIVLLPQPQSVAQSNNCDVNASQLAQSQSEKALFDLINSYRTQNGVAILSWSSGLSRAAAWLSSDMASKNYFSHTDSLGRNPGTRLTDCGFSWSAYGENIFPNSSDPQAVFDGWKNSPPHNEAMLNSSYSQAGIGADGVYWTLDLGTGSSSNIDPIQPPTQIPPPVISTTTSPAPNTKLTPTITPTPTSAVILNPTDTVMQINIKLAGIGKGKNEFPKNLTRLVTVNVFNLENKKILSGVNYLKYNYKDGFVGDVHLGQIADGAYYIKIQGINTLSALVVPEFQTLKSNQLNIIPQVFLIQGDLNSDNTISISDFNIALLCFQGKKCPGDISVDFNDNGLADVVDYNIFLASFKRSVGD